MADRYRLIGSEGSPYSVKLRAILRYRRLPFLWIQRTGEVLEQTAHVRPAIIPMLQYPEDDTFHVDSTPLAYELERRHPVVRSILPDDSIVAIQDQSSRGILWNLSYVVRSSQLPVRGCTNHLELPKPSSQSDNEGDTKKTPPTQFRLK